MSFLTRTEPPPFPELLLSLFPESQDIISSLSKDFYSTDKPPSETSHGCPEIDDTSTRSSQKRLTQESPHYFSKELTKRHRRVEKPSELYGKSLKIIYLLGEIFKNLHEKIETQPEEFKMLVPFKVTEGGVFTFTVNFENDLNARKKIETKFQSRPSSSLSKYEDLQKLKYLMYSYWHHSPEFKPISHKAILLTHAHYTSYSRSIHLPEDLINHPFFKKLIVKGRHEKIALILRYTFQKILINSLVEKRQVEAYLSNGKFTRPIRKLKDLPSQYDNYTCDSPLGAHIDYTAKQIIENNLNKKFIPNKSEIEAEIEQVINSTAIPAEI